MRIHKVHSQQVKFCSVADFLADFVSFLILFKIIHSTYRYIRGFTNFEITVACGLKFHWYLRTLSLEFQKARTKIEVQLQQPTGQRQENFNFGPRLLKS